MKLTNAQKTHFDRLKRNIQAYVRRYTGGIETYPQWYCGITQNPDSRLIRHRQNAQVDTLEYYDWNAQWPIVAKELEYYFHKKGMQGAMSAGNWKKASFIYIFERPLD